MAVGNAAIALAAGVASHFFYFRIGEHHMLGTTYIQLFTLACIGSVAGLVNLAGYSIRNALTTTSTLAGFWLLGVYSSLAIYRLFFHPLRNFPGPWQARLGDLFMSTRLTKLDGYRIFLDLHKKHGQFVRVGSNTLSITDPEIMQPAYSAHSKVIKADWYDGSNPHQSMHTTRDKGVHDRRRRVWAPAFSDKALRDYEVVVKDFNDKFVRKIGEYRGGVVNVTTWFNLYSFDVMGRLAFGKDYGMLESGQRHWALDLLTEGMELGGLKLPTWLFRILLAIPGAAGGYYKFLNFCSDELRKRVKNGGKEGANDITGWLLKAYANEKQPEEDMMLQGDARLIVVAGSDTTSATLTFLFYHLALDPSQQQKLRDELKPLTSNDDWSDKDIQHADHLNGAINEALRLHPPVPSGLMRKTPKEGLQIGETYIPGNTKFCTPQYPMGRDDRIYPDAEKFMPERWYSKPEYIAHPDAFAPFSQGPFNCIGRNLARMELRTLTAQILLNYTVALAPGEDGERLLRKSKDHFTMSLGQLDLVFSPLAR